MAQTPLNLNLAPIYLNQENRNNIKWSMLPPSQGEDSINQEEQFQPSFKWLASSLIDPNLIQIDNIQPKKVEKGKVAQQWRGINQIILVNIKQKIYVKQEIKQIQNIIKLKYQKYTWLKFKRAKQIFYKGKPSVILKFGDQNSASFVYFNLLSWKTNRQQFGENCQIFRVVKDNLRDVNKLKNWILLLFRRLPLTMTKENLLSQLTSNDFQIKWMDQLIEISGYKYGLCKVNYLDDALALCSIFNSKKIKDSKINIHPKSSKNWKAEQMTINQLDSQEDFERK